MSNEIEVPASDDDDNTTTLDGDRFHNLLQRAIRESKDEPLVWHYLRSGAMLHARRNGDTIEVALGFMADYEQDAADRAKQYGYPLETPTSEELNTGLMVMVAPVEWLTPRPQG